MSELAVPIPTLASFLILPHNKAARLILFAGRIVKLPREVLTRFGDPADRSEREMTAEVYRVPFRGVARKPAP
jgi:hypothetical protein